jgi:membrane associated rhomboid family serine protease
MLALWNIGRPVVRLWGARTFAVVWIGASVSGGAIHLYWPQIMAKVVNRKIISKPFGHHDPTIPIRVVGASGSVCGMIELMTAAFPALLMTQTLTFVALSLACIYQGWLPYIGHIDHLGGMALGAAWFAIAMRGPRGW